MDNNKPADQAVQDELNRIYTDKSHPHYEGFWSNKKESVQYRDNLMARVPASEDPFDGGLNRILSDAMKEPGQAAPGEAKPAGEEGAPAELSPEEIEVENNRAVGELRVAWGHDFDSRFQVTREIAHSIHEHPDESIKNLGRQATEILAASEIGQVGAARLIDAVITAVKEKVIREMAEGK